MIAFKTSALAFTAALACLSSVSAQDAVECKVIPHGEQSSHKLGPAIPLLVNVHQITRTQLSTTFNDKDYKFFVDPFDDRTIFQTTLPEKTKKYVFTIELNNRSIVQVPLDATLDNFCTTPLIVKPDMVKLITVHETI